MRRFRQGLNISLLWKYSFFQIAAIFLFLVLCNAGLSHVEQASGATLDLTESRAFTLLGETSRVLSEIEEPVSIYYVYAPYNRNERVSKLVNIYAAHSPKITVRNVNTQLGTDVLGNFTIPYGAASPSYLIVSGEESGRYRVVAESDMRAAGEQAGGALSKAELKITSAIDYVNTGVSRRAVFLTGHNETSPTALRELSEYLDYMNYQVTAADLGRSEALNPDTDILLVLSPKSDLTDAEYGRLHDFLSNGGSALFALDASAYSATSGELQLYLADTPRLNALLKLYGLSMNQDIVVAEGSSAAGLRPTTIRAASVGGDAIRGGISAIFSEAASLSLHLGKESAPIPLLAVGEDCYAKALTYAFDGDFARDRQSTAGPLVLGAACQRGASRVALFGSSAFLGNEELHVGDNAKLLDDTMVYLSKASIKLNIPARTRQESVAASSTQRFFMVLAMAGVIPIVILALGLLHWSRRFNGRASR